MDRLREVTTAEDIGKVVRMVQLLAQAVSGPQECDLAHTGATVLRLMHSSSAIVLLSDDGFIAGEVIQSIISPDPIAFEHGWFASGRSGLRLLAAFEAWAESMGCTVIKMSSAADSGGAGKILSRRGYRPVELAWVK